MLRVFKSLFLILLNQKLVAQCIQSLVLRMHNTFYDLGSLIAITINDGVHPKHQILQYKEWFLRFIDGNSVVLDVGSNTGMMAALMANKAKFVYGIEINKKHSEAAQKNYHAHNLKFLTGDATTYDYKGCQPISCITLSNVLEHIDDRVNFLKKLQEVLIWSDLTPRLFLIRVPTVERDWISVYKKNIGVEYRLDRTHKIEHTRQQLLSELTNAGLSVVNFETRFGEYYVICHG
jgi:2-polyprenyl-3-methyl-5-hydroxy-6-metoxy-1,4-benzoquinol methylase